MPPSTWVMAGGGSGSAIRQLNGDLLLSDGSLTTTRDFRPLLTTVERVEFELTVVPASLGTSHSGPAVTALGMAVPGGQPGGLP
jgi:hypothetical protein